MHAPVVPLPGTVYEKVLRSQQPDLRADGDDRHTLVVPVTDRGDAMGVIEMTVPWAPSERDVADVEECARALAYVVVGCRRHTDLFEWAQRSLPFSLAAEIQRRLLPAAFTCEAGQLTVSGWLEPANAVGGDTFDYSLDRDTLHVSITDAVGHDVHAAMLATLLVGSLRNGRRREQGLLEQAAAANDALAAYSGPGDFVTGQLVRVNRHTARMSIVNAGHPFPYRVHEGVVDRVELAIDMPFGLRPGAGVHLPGGGAAPRRPDRARHRRHPGAQRGLPGNRGAARRHRRPAPQRGRLHHWGRSAPRHRRRSP